MTLGRMRDVDEIGRRLTGTAIDRRRLLRAAGGFGAAAPVGGTASAVPTRAAGTLVANQELPPTEREALTATLQQVEATPTS